MKVCPHCRRCYEESADSCAQDKCALDAGRPGARLVARKYTLERLLEEDAGQGVYSARHTETGRTYAVKLLPPDEGADAEAAKGFRRAALAAAHLNTRVDHQHVAKTYDYGLLHDGTVYVVTELVGGRSLRAHVDESGPLPAATAAHIARQVADGLDAAHRQGIYHHALDPTHVILTRGHDERPEVKLVDFGLAALRKRGAAESAGAALAQSAGGSATRVRDAAPATSYAAPEQLGGQGADARSDIYSLGAILYEMLAGGPPPTAHGHEDGPPPVFAVRDDVPIPLARLVSQLLRARPPARPHSAAEVSRRLRAVEDALASGDTSAHAADDSPLYAEEADAPRDDDVNEDTHAGVAAQPATASSVYEGARELGTDAADYEDLDALQEELGGDLDEIVVGASSPANLGARAARPSARGRYEAVGKPRVALIILTTLAAIVTGVACGLWLTSRSASLPPTETAKAESASTTARGSETITAQSETATTQGETAAAQGEAAAAETSSNVETEEQPASAAPAPSAEAGEQPPESARGAADEGATEKSDSPKAKVVEAKPVAETEARSGAASASASPAGAYSSNAPVAREAGRPSDGRCALSLSEGSLSITAGGGSAAITVNTGGAAGVKASTSNWPDIAVFSDGRGGEGGRVRYTIISVSKRAGTFAVTFNSPCGTKTVPVTVRQR